MLQLNNSQSTRENQLNEPSLRLPLVTTKLGPPRHSKPLLARYRLLEQLKPIQFCKLALIQAAAGFGKTSVLAHWHQLESQAGKNIAWLSLDENNNHPQRFSQYLIAALNKIYDAWRPSFQRLLDSETAISESVLYRALINELNSLQQEFYLIIDDYHCINNQKIHDDVCYLLTHSPDNFHLILGTREVPPLPLANLRGQGQVIEIDDTNLRFTLNEIKGYFSENTTIKLSNADFQRLLEFTEGWVTGIQLASLTPGLLSNTSETIKLLSSGTRAISHYLKEIIFDQLDQKTLQFLMQTSILERLNAPLCEAITGIDNGQEMLEQLEAKKLFLSALDDTGEWYRYHNLFANALRLLLKRDKSVNKNELHKRASQWFMDNNYWAEAIRHSLATNDIENTLMTAEQAAKSLAEEGDVETLVDWLKQLMTEVDPKNINLQFTLIWGLIHRFQFDEAKQLIDKLSLALQTTTPVQDENALVELELYKAIYLAAKDDSKGAMAICAPLSKQLPMRNERLTGLACNLFSWCCLMESRYEQMAEIQRLSPRTSQPLDSLFITAYRNILKGLACMRQAQFDTAHSHIFDTLKWSEKHTGTASTATLSIAPYLSEIYYERDQWEQLDLLLTHRQHLIDKVTLTDGRIRTYIAMIRVAQYTNSPFRAESLIEYGLRQSLDYNWYRLQSSLLHERVHFQLNHKANELGTLDRAKTALQQIQQLWNEHGTDTPCALCEIYDYLHQAKARVLIAEGQYNTVTSLLSPLISKKVQQGDHLIAIRLRILLAIAQHLAERTILAFETLKPALDIAKQQGIIRSFIDEGDVMHKLLLATINNDSGIELPDAFIKILLDKFDVHALDVGVRKQRTAKLDDTQKLTLSERELEILLLAAEGQSNKKIALSLNISAETVKWHLKNIYTKLNAKGRVQAISTAQRLGLINT